MNIKEDNQSNFKFKSGLFNDFTDRNYVYQKSKDLQEGKKRIIDDIKVEKKDFLQSAKRRNTMSIKSVESASKICPKKTISNSSIINNLLASYQIIENNYENLLIRPPQHLEEINSSPMNRLDVNKHQSSFVNQRLAHSNSLSVLPTKPKQKSIDNAKNIIEKKKLYRIKTHFENIGLMN